MKKSALAVYPDSVLRKKSVDISKEEADKLGPKLVSLMISNGGIGLAAPQIGISKRMAVVSEKADEKISKPLVLINPRIIKTAGRTGIQEGCLSLESISAEVPRSSIIKVETGLRGERRVIEAEGMLAIVIQHEMDHLDGILFPDRLGFFKRKYLYLKAKKKR